MNVDNPLIRATLVEALANNRAAAHNARQSKGKIEAVIDTYRRSIALQEDYLRETNEEIAGYEAKIAEYEKILGVGHV